MHEIHKPYAEEGETQEKRVAVFGLLKREPSHAEDGQGNHDTEKLCNIVKNKIRGNVHHAIKPRVEQFHRQEGQRREDKDPR